MSLLAKILLTVSVVFTTSINYMNILSKIRVLELSTDVKSLVSWSMMLTLGLIIYFITKIYEYKRSLRFNVNVYIFMLLFFFQ